MAKEQTGRFTCAVHFGVLLAVPEAMATTVQETDLVKTRLPRGFPFDAWSLGVRITFVLTTALAYVVAFLSLYYLVDRPIAVMSLVPAAASGWLLGLRGGLLGGLMVALLNFSLFGLVEGFGWHPMLHGTITSLFSAGTGPLFGLLSQLFDTAQRQSGELATEKEFLLEQIVQRRRAEETLRRAENELEMRVEQRTAELSRANEELHREIIEHRASEAWRRESEEKFRTVLETAVDGVVSVDTRGEIVFANKACERLFGYGEGELVSKPLILLIPERFHRGHQEGFKRLLATGESRVLGKMIELAGRRRDGREFPLELTLSTWKAGGSVFFTGVIRDITERREAERALAESEYRYRLVSENAADVIWVRNLNLRVRYISPSVERLRGYSVEEAMAQPIEETLAQASCDIALKALADAVAMVDEKGSTPFFSRTLELEVRRKDGSTVWTESTISFLRDEDGRPTGILGVTRDLSERKRAEEALRQSEKLAAMGELLAGVAHELNNPLSVVIGQTFLLRKAFRTGVVAKRAAAIAQSAERCSRIVRNFLSLARRRPAERQTVRINKVVEDTLELLGYELRLHRVEVTQELAEGLPLLGADPYQLQQVLVNLVVNALHAMRETNGPRRLTLRSRLDPAEGRIVLEVADTGPGIPAEIQARIFEPFFTTKPPGEGTGLGLSLCQATVKEHGGTIRIESAPGRGTIFRIELPVVAPPESELTAQAAQPLPPTAAMTILVVDDEPEIATLLVDVLSADKHRVETTPNGALALTKLEERKYDLILCDIKMPELDGPGFYHEMARRFPALQRRVIFITGDALTAATRSFLEKTGAPSLEKPFDLVELRQVVQRIGQRA